MRIISFRTPKPKSFKYIPRYYDKQKEELEKRKAAMGLDNELTHNEGLRLRMDKRWRTGNADAEKSTLSKVVTYLIYSIFIVGSIYIIMFTDIVKQILSAFGVTK